MKHDFYFLFLESLNGFNVKIFISISSKLRADPKVKILIRRITEFLDVTEKISECVS